MLLRPQMIVALLALAAAGCAQNRPAITVASLNENPVIGDLQLPLGTVAEIRATIISGEELGKAYQSSYLLRVTAVNGRTLEQPLSMARFGLAPGASVKLASDWFELYELRNGEKPRSVSSEQIRKLEEGYVGREVCLVVYETGRYSGIPDNLPKNVGHWQDVGFGFDTSLVVLAQRP